MTRPSRLFSKIAAAALVGIPMYAAMAQEVQPAKAPEPMVPGQNQPAPPDKALMAQAETVFHYASLGRHKLAADKLTEMLGANPDPAETLRAFQWVIDDRNSRVIPSLQIVLDEQAIRWAAIPEMKEPAGKLIEVFKAARAKKHSDPAYIESQIQRLLQGERARAFAIEELRLSGEVAVPVMVNYLRDTTKGQYHSAIRLALQQMGQKALAPLLAATEIKDPNLLPWVCGALGDIGYDAAVPYLLRLSKDKDAPPAGKLAAEAALGRLGVEDYAQRDAAQAFYDLAKKYYYDRSALTLPKSATQAFVWLPTAEGLKALTVPAVTYNEDLALRACEAVLKLDPKRADAWSLWISAGFKREVQLPEGATDPLWDANHPPTHFYASGSGAQNLYPVLSQAMGDTEAGVALKAVKSLQTIIGASSLPADADNPLTAAMKYPDRQVRFESAYAAAKALPQQTFYGHERVVPILAEALAQTGKAGVLVLAPSDKLNATREMLKAYNVQGGETPEAAVANALALTSVDAVLVSEDHPGLAKLIDLLNGNVRLERAARVVIVKSKVASPYRELSEKDPLITVTDAADEAGLAASIEEARKRAAGLPVDEKLATDMALRAAGVLKDLAISRGQPLDLQPAHGALLAAIDDARLEVAKAAGDVLAKLNFKAAQPALAVKALDEATKDEYRIPLLRNLAESARHFGTQVDPAQIEGLVKLAQTAQNIEVRSAAAEALGAMNLKAEQIRALIVDQAK